MKHFIVIALVILSGCVPLETPAVEPLNEPSSQAAKPPANARAVEEFDTTTPEDRVAATKVSTGGRLVGTTVATLGNPSEPGFWIETPLVTSPGSGRIAFSDTGKSVQVELRPISGGSSRVSLAALRLLEAPLTDLVTIDVFAQ